MDHASELLKAVTTVLQANVPMAGDWLAIRVSEPAYPFGTIDVTASEPQRGQGYYSERHTGVISVWCKTAESGVAALAQCYQLCNDAHTILGSIVFNAALQITSFAPGTMVPRSDPDGATFGRSFTFTAITHEVKNV